MADEQFLGSPSHNLARERALSLLSFFTAIILLYYYHLSTLATLDDGGRRRRGIRSYVLRQGRLTNGQQHALEMIALLDPDADELGVLEFTDFGATDPDEDDDEVAACQDVVRRAGLELV